MYVAYIAAVVIFAVGVDGRVARERWESRTDGCGIVHG